MNEKEIMEKIIPEKLAEIEKKENVKILHCVESGSRAWGFASPDSDFDVRFIYVRPKDFYLRLDKTRDVIEWQLDETLDINGWDLQKALKLLHNSNPTIFEWDSSPIVYKTTPEWKEISNIIKQYFKEKNGLYHYLHTAKSNFKEHLQCEIVKLKKYFYVLRPILACKWILEKKCPPPMPFSTLMSACLEKEITPTVNKLLELKIKTPEFGTGKSIPALNNYITTQIETIENTLKTHPSPPPQPWHPLNTLFQNILK